MILKGKNVWTQVGLMQQWAADIALYKIADKVTGDFYRHPFPLRQIDNLIGILRRNMEYDY